MRVSFWFNIGLKGCSPITKKSKEIKRNIPNMLMWVKYMWCMRETVGLHVMGSFSNIWSTIENEPSRINLKSR